jgi:hypothetical protein
LIFDEYIKILTSALIAPMMAVRIGAGTQRMSCRRRDAGSARLRRRQQAAMGEERMRVDMVREGKITAEEAVRLLEALKASTGAPSGPAAGSGAQSGPEPGFWWAGGDARRGERWRRGPRQDDPMGGVFDTIGEAIASALGSKDWSSLRDEVRREVRGASRVAGRRVEAASDPARCGARKRRRERETEGWEFVASPATTAFALAEAPVCGWSPKPVASRRRPAMARRVNQGTGPQLRRLRGAQGQEVVVGAPHGARARMPPGGGVPRHVSTLGAYTMGGIKARRRSRWS